MEVINMVDDMEKNYHKLLDFLQNLNISDEDITTLLKETLKNWDNYDAFLNMIDKK